MTTMMYNMFPPGLAISISVLTYVITSILWYLVGRYVGRESVTVKYVPEGIVHDGLILHYHDHDVDTSHSRSNITLNNVKNVKNDKQNN